jgi:hypothetical protein
VSVVYLPKALAVNSDGCSYGFGLAWNFAMGCRGTASSFACSAVVDAVATNIAELRFCRSHWLLGASLAVLALSRLHEPS